MTWLDAIWCVVIALTDAGPSALLLIAAAAAGLLVLLWGTATAAPGETGRAFQRKAERAGVPRHRDPDAPGRTRPRGPTARPWAAA
jgi:hypothetical protein